MVHERYLLIGEKETTFDLVIADVIDQFLLWKNSYPKAEAHSLRGNAEVILQKKLDRDAINYKHVNRYIDVPKSLYPNLKGFIDYMCLANEIVPAPVMKRNETSASRCVNMLNNIDYDKIKQWTW